MANTLPIVHKRTSISGRLPEVTNTQSSSYIRPGELSINLTDKKVHSSNGSALFEVGSNLTNLSVQTITANGTVGVQDQILRSDGTKAYWDYFVGYAGSRGATGFTGSQGPIGFTGSQGVIGFTGSQGILGGVAQANIDMNGLTISNASVINAVSVNISGNLTVSGTATTVNTVNLDVADAIVRLNRGQATPANDIGIMMQRFAVANSINYNVGFAWDEGSDRLIFGTTPEDGSDNDLSFSTEWMTILANGNVGVGTSTPLEKLAVQSVGESHVRISSSDNAGNVGIKFTGAGDRGGIYASALYNIHIEPNAQYNNPYVIIKGKNEGTYDVKVGIGSTNPATKLVVSNSNAEGYEINPTGGVGGGATVSAYNRNTSAYTTLTTYASAMTWYAGATRAIDMDSSGNIGIGGVPTSKLTIRDTLTANNTYTLEVNPTWNATANTFTAIRANVTDTASNTNSLLMDLRVGEVSRASISKTGLIIASAHASAIGVNPTTSPNGLTFSGSNGRTHISQPASPGSGLIFWQDNGAGTVLTVSQTALRIQNGMVLQWSDTDSNLTPNLTIARDANDTLAQRRGANAQTFRLYGTFTDASNYERLSISANATGNYITSERAGTGSPRSLNLTATNGEIILNDGNSQARMTSGFWQFGSRILSEIWGITSSNRTITASSPLIDLGQTWNATANTFTASRINVTDTASNTNSLLMDLQVGGTSKFNVTKHGELNIIAGARTNIPALNLTNLGEGTGFLTASFASGGQFFMDITTGTFNITSVNRQGFSFSASGTGKASGNYLFNNDSNSLLAGGPLAAFAAAGVRRTEITQTGAVRSFGTFTDASNNERITLSANTTGAYIIADSIGTGTARSLFLGANNSTHITVAANGNVGIGGAANATRLNVTGSMTVQNYIFGSDAAANNEIIAGVDSSGFFFAGGYNRATNIPVIIGGTTGDIIFRTNFSGTGAGDRVRFTNTGRVGIGTATPTTNMEIYGGASGVLTNFSLGNAATAVQLLVDASNNIQMRTAQAVNMSFWTNNTERMRIDPNGNIGIGNTAPASKLTIQETLTANNATTLEVNPTWNATANTFTAIRTNVTDTASNTNSLLADLQVGGASRFNIRKDGSTTINGSTHYTNILNNIITICNNGTGFKTELIHSGNESFYIKPYGVSVLMVSAVDFTPSVQILANKSFGWSSSTTAQTQGDLTLHRDAADTLAQRRTTNAQALRVYGTFTDASNHERVSLSANGSGAYLLAEEAGTGVARDLFIGANNTTHVTVAANGNMGIGTTVPVDRLHIRSAGRSWRHDSTTHGNLYAEFINSGGVQYFTIRTDNSSPSLRLETVNKDIHLLPGSSNVGIGTTSPTNKLFVTGDIGLDGISVRDTATTTTTAVTQITLFEYPIATYDSCDVIIKAVSGGERHTTKLLVTANSTVAIGTEYGTLLTGSSLYSVDCDISGANTRIRITPATTTSTVFKASYELITA